MWRGRSPVSRERTPAVDGVRRRSPACKNKDNSPIPEGARITKRRTTLERDQRNASTLSSSSMLYFSPRNWSIRCGLLAIALSVNFLTIVIRKNTFFRNGNSMGRVSLNGTSIDRDPKGTTSVGSKHRWIKVSKSELNDYRAKEAKACRRPFKHCCLGQGRQLLTNSFNDTSHLEVKWSGPTSDLASVLDAMHDNDVP